VVFLLPLPPEPPVLELELELLALDVVPSFADASFGPASAFASFASDSVSAFGAFAPFL